ncbi:hypothetical protein KCV00_g61, partial [Aureobasidium melanogenum]
LRRRYKTKPAITHSTTPATAPTTMPAIAPPLNPSESFARSGGLAIAVNLVSVEASWVIASAIATGMLLVEKRVQGGKANHQVVVRFRSAKGTEMLSIPVSVLNENFRADGDDTISANLVSVVSQM